MPIRSSIANSLKAYGDGRTTNNMVRPRTDVVDYIMVAGGGGGGGNGGGGGGGGGLYVGSGYPIGTGPSFVLNLNTGGAGGLGGGGAPSNGGNGGDSIISGPGTPTVTVAGGGYGGGPGQAGGSGGSGGGGGRDQPGPGPYNPTSAGSGNVPALPSPAPAQGRRGGYGGVPPFGAAGSGGGFGGTGQDGAPEPQGYGHDIARNGGDGRNIGDFWAGYDYSYLNRDIPPTAPAQWTGFIMGCGGGNGIQSGADGTIGGLGGSSSSIPALYPRTGGNGGAGGPTFPSPGYIRANSGTQYTGSGGGGGGKAPSDPYKDGGLGAGGSIIVRFDQYYKNVTSTTGTNLYSSQNGYHTFHFIGPGTLTFT